MVAILVLPLSHDPPDPEDNVYVCVYAWQIVADPLIVPGAATTVITFVVYAVDPQDNAPP